VYDKNKYKTKFTEEHEEKLRMDKAMKEQYKETIKKKAEK